MMDTCTSTSDMSTLSAYTSSQKFSVDPSHLRLLAIALIPFIVIVNPSVVVGPISCEVGLGVEGGFVGVYVGIPLMGGLVKGAGVVVSSTIGDWDGLSVTTGDLDGSSVGGSVGSAVPTTGCRVGFFVGDFDGGIEGDTVG